MQHRSEIDSKEPGRHEVRRHVIVRLMRRGARRALLRDRRKTVIGTYDDVGCVRQAELRERRTEAREIVIGISDAGEGCWAVDSRRQPPKTVTLVVLTAVRVARPENEDERFATLCEQR